MAIPKSGHCLPKNLVYIVLGYLLLTRRPALFTYAQFTKACLHVLVIHILFIIMDIVYGFQQVNIFLLYSCYNKQKVCVVVYIMVPYINMSYIYSISRFSSIYFDYVYIVFNMKK